MALGLKPLRHVKAATIEEVKLFYCGASYFGMKVRKVEELRTHSILFQLYQSVHHTTGQQRSKSKCIGVDARQTKCSCR